MPKDEHFYEAKATFEYSFGITAGEISVDSKLNNPKLEDDWKINLALDAGARISEKYSVQVKAITLKLIAFGVVPN